MILPLAKDAIRLAVRIRSYGGGQVSDWKHLQLCIIPGQIDASPCCGPEASPWYFHGCWPGVRTDVDLNDVPMGDIPVVVSDAFELDDEGRVVFLLGPFFPILRPGRHTGIVRFMPHNLTPVFLDVHGIPRKPPKAAPILPDGYDIGMECGGNPPAPPPPPCRPPEICVLARFDIDITPACGEHFIDEAAVDFALDLCGE